jgi:serine/threonine-protein kinase
LPVACFASLDGRHAPCDDRSGGIQAAEGAVLHEGLRVSDELQLSRRIGFGSMGEVWIARHVTLATDVAVKFIHDEALRTIQAAEERFRREAENARYIQSQHVVSVFDYARMSDGTPYLVMELLEGETVEDILEAQGPLAMEEVADLLWEVGAALDAAHALGIVHRDIKPANVFAHQGPEGRVFKVLDFGNAKLIAQSFGSNLSSPGIVAGSPAYVSRDVLLDHNDLDRRVDLWALGVTAYKCLTGELPFRGTSINDTCEAIVEGKLRKASRSRGELGTAADEWFARVFSFDPRERPNTGAAMATSFVTALGLSLPPSEPSAPRSSMSESKRREAQRQALARQEAERDEVRRREAQKTRRRRFGAWAAVLTAALIGGVCAAAWVSSSSTPVGAR